MLLGKSEGLVNATWKSMDIILGVENVQLFSGASDVDVTAGALQLAGTGIASKADAQANMETIDNAIQKVSANRAVLGALQNRLGSTVTNLGTQTENLSAANSRITG